MMICSTCHHTTARIRIIKGRERCSNCAGFSEANGTRIDGVLSRQRVRDQGVKYEGDILNPWLYDKSSRDFKPNDEFLKRHGDNAHNFFGVDDLKDYPKLQEKMYTKAIEDDGIGEGDFTSAVQDVITQA